MLIALVAIQTVHGVGNLLSIFKHMSMSNQWH